MLKKRDWTVLFVCGASGCGKSSFAYETGRFYGVNVMEIDDIHLAVKAVTAADTHPAIHHWQTAPDWTEVGVSANVEWLKAVGCELFAVLRQLALRHIEDDLPVIIEGDFINPQPFAEFSHPQVKLIQLYEPDEEQLVRNYQSREGGARQSYRARISIEYGNWLRETCCRSGFEVIDARPWDTLLDRFVGAQGGCP